MQGPFRPEIPADPAHTPLSAETLGSVLSREPFADLYRLTEWEPFPYFARLNGRGEVEICLVFESADAFVEAARDEAAIDFHTYQDRLIAVVWTIADSREPLGFPLRFAVQDERDRHLALRLAEQPAIPVHYLALEAGHIVHVYTEEINLPPAEREWVINSIRRLYQSGAAAGSAAGAGDDAPVESMAIHQLSDQDLTNSGIAYLVDYERLEQRLGAEGSELAMMEAVRQAVREFRRGSPAGQLSDDVPSAGVTYTDVPSDDVPSALTVWAGRLNGAVWLCVTPALPAGAGPAGRAGETAEADETGGPGKKTAMDPFAHSLLALPEFVEIRPVRPLTIGAYPIIHCDQGRVFQVELDETAQARLRSLCRQAGLVDPNPYEG